MLASPFLQKLHDDTLSLLVEARNYASADLARRKARPGVPVILADSVGMLAITARLTHVMSWILAQRAVGADEMSLGEALSDRYALASASLPGHPPVSALSPVVADLLARTNALFDRGLRLEALMRASA